MAVADMDTMPRHSISVQRRSDDESEDEREPSGLDNDDINNLFMLVDVLLTACKFHTFVWPLTQTNCRDSADS